MILRLIMITLMATCMVGGAVETTGAAALQDAAQTAVESAQDAIKEAPGTTSGNQALQLWDENGIANSPQWVQIWLQIMIVSFALGLLFIWKKVEARWVVGGILIAFTSSGFIAQALGLQVLSGYIALIHLIFWSPALYFLLKNKPWQKTALGLYDQAYKYWTILITAVICFSFIFDIRDAAIYLDYMFGVGLLT